MRTRCPRCQYAHSVEPADMVRNILSDKAHKGAVFVVLPTKGTEKLHVIKPEHVEKVLAAYSASIEKHDHIYKKENDEG